MVTQIDPNTGSVLGTTCCQICRELQQSLGKRQVSYPLGKRVKEKGMQGVAFNAGGGEQG